MELEIQNTSRKFSHMIYVNDYEIIHSAAKTDTDNSSDRYSQEILLNKSVNVLVEPVSEIISVAFYMKSGRATFFKNSIRLPVDMTKEESWYQEALNNKNQVVVGSYNIGDKNQLYQHGKSNSLVLVYALAPNQMIDRTDTIESICFYETSKTADRIKAYNAGYLQGANKLGITRIVDGQGRIIYDDEKAKKYQTGKV